MAVAFSKNGTIWSLLFNDPNLDKTNGLLAVAKLNLDSTNSRVNINTQPFNRVTSQMMYSSIIRNTKNTENFIFGYGTAFDLKSFSP